MRILNAKGQQLAEEFEDEYSDRGCSCHLSPPCSYCIHPGNPLNLEEDESLWIEQDELHYELQFVRGILANAWDNSDLGF